MYRLFLSSTDSRIILAYGDRNLHNRRVDGRSWSKGFGVLL